MRPLLLLLLLLAPFTASSQGWPYSLEDTLGKSESQILSMGREAWFDFYTAQPGGSSTAGMSDAETIFGQALKRRNDRSFASSSADRRSKIGALRKHMSEFYAACTELSAAFAGGGTMWTNVHAGISASVEEKIGILAGFPQKAAPARTASDVTKRLDLIDAVIRKQRAELEIYKGSGYGHAIAVAELAKARKALAGVLAIAKSLPRAQSDAFLDACLQRATVIEFNID